MISFTILKNMFWLSIGEGALRVSLFFVMVLAARAMGPVDFGVFSFAFALVSLFVVFSNFGLSETLTRELSQGMVAPHEYRGILLFKILLSGIVFLLILGVSFFASSDQSFRETLWFLGGYTLVSNFLSILYPFFRAQNRIEYEAGMKIFQALCVVGGGIFMLQRVASPQAFSSGLFWGSVLSVIVMTIFFILSMRLFVGGFTFEVGKRVFSRSWPLGLASALGVVSVYIDSVMMGFWGQVTEVGWYNAAYRIVGALIIPAVLIGLSFFPTVSRLFKESRDQFRRIVEGEVTLMVLVAIPLAVGGFMFARDLIIFFYGTGFTPAVLAFQFLIVMAAVSYVYIPFYLALIASGNQKTYLWVTGTGALANVLMNLFLIPRFSLYGAAVSTLVSSFLLLILVIAFSVHFSLFSISMKKLSYVLITSSLSTTLMIGALSTAPLNEFHVIAKSILGAFLFGVGLLFFIKIGFLRTSFFMGFK